jgi:hypothetical protein
MYTSAPEITTLEKITGKFHLLDYTDDAGKTYHVDQLSNSDLTAWVDRFEIRSDATVTLHYRDQGGSSWQQETKAIVTGPTYYIDDFHLLIFEELLILFLDAKAFRYYHADNPCWHE